MRSFLRRLGRHAHAGTWVALWWGLLLGLALGAFLAGFQNAELAFRGAGERAAAILFLGCLGALAGSALLVPLELAVALLRSVPALGRRPLGRRRFYRGAFGIGVVSVHAFFYAGFQLVRDLKSPLGMAVLAAFAVLVPVALWLWARIGAGPGGAAGDGVSGPRVAALGVALLVLIALGGWSRHRLAPPAEGSEDVGSGAQEMLEPGSHGGPAGVTELPDLVLISIDTLRADHLGCYGYRRDTTPHLDALAAEGTLFVQAYSPAPWTLPSHATMLTGLYPWSHGARFSDNTRFMSSHIADTLALENLTLAEVLTARGYATGAFTSAKWLSSTFGLDQGFQEFAMDIDDHPARILVDRGIRWLREAPAGRPTFLFLHFFDVHEYEAPPAYSRRFQEGAYDGKVRGREKKAMGNLWQSLSPEDLAYLEARYDGALAYVDAELGRLFSWLRESGRYPGSLIAVTSDHGEEFWDHGGTGHGFTLYQEQLRVPLIFKLPAAVAGRSRIEARVGLVDLVPTVLDLSGLPPLPHAEGRSLKPLMEGAPEPERRLFAGATFFRNRAAVMQGDLKYISNRIPPPDLFDLRLWQVNLRAFYKFAPPELYDLAADPGERSDLSGRRREVAGRLRGELTGVLQRQRRGESVTLDPATVEQLRALGYLR